MYLPPAFREDDLARQHALIRAFPLGLIVTAGEDGLIANPAPFLLYADEGERGTLRAHISRANSQWKELARATECLVVFQGADAYISPAWYASKQESQKVVPTWNYATVHVWGKPRVVEDSAWLRRQVEDLTRVHEQERPEPWTVSDAPESYVAAQLRGITGIELPIGRIEGKWKVSQNRSSADQSGVVQGLLAEGERGAAMAAMVAERGSNPAK